MPLLIFLQFLLHPKMSVLYQIQQGTHATWIFLKSKTMCRKECFEKWQELYFGTRIGWWMKSLSFPALYRCNNKRKHKSKRSRVKSAGLLLPYCHLYTLGHVSIDDSNIVSYWLVEVSCNHAAGGQHLEPQSFGRRRPSMHPTRSERKKATLKRLVIGHEYPYPLYP